MKRWMTFTGLLALSLFALAGCGGGGGGGGTPVGTGELLSTNSVMHMSPVTDGTWAIWQGRDRERVMAFDGADLIELSGAERPGHIIREVAYDGRYLVFKSSDSSRPHNTDVFYYDAQNNGAIVNASNIPDTLGTDPSVQNLKVGGGYIFWTAKTPEGGPYVFAHKIADKRTTQLGEGNGLSTSPLAASGSLVAFIDGDQLWYADLAVSNAATTISTASVNNSYVRVTDRTIVWQGQVAGDYEILKFDVDNDDAAIDFSNVAGASYEPVVSDDAVVWRQLVGSYYQIFYKTLATPSVSAKLTSTYTHHYNPQAKDGFAAWTDGSDYQIYFADLTAGALTVASTVTQASSDFYPSNSGNGSDEGGYDSRKFALGNGRIVYEVSNPDGENTDTNEYLFSYDLESGDTVRLADASALRRIRSLKAAGGVNVWVSVGAFDRVFARKIGDAAEPVAISPEWTTVNWLDLDHGIAAWGGKPAVIDDSSLWDIYYADLNAPVIRAVRVTDSNIGDKEFQPAVDGVNGLISYSDASYSGIFLYTIGSPVNSGIYLGDASGGGTEGVGQSSIEDGIVVWQNGSGYVTFYNDKTGETRDLGYYTDDCPRIGGGVIAWRYGGDLYYYDFNSGIADVAQVTTEADPYSVAVGGGYLVMNAYSSSISKYVVCAYEVGDAPSKVSVLGSYENYPDDPRVDENGILIWSAMPDGSDNQEKDHELYMCDLTAANPAIERLTDDIRCDEQPAITDGYVTWRRGGLYEEPGDTFVYGLRLK